MCNNTERGDTVTALGRNINAIDRYLRQKRREYMEPLGLKGIHAWLCVTICGAPGASQDQIVKKLWFDKSTIARQLELLEGMGFVERKPSATDKRVICVYPTQKMLEFLPGLNRAMDEREAFLLDALEPEEQEQLLALLRKIRRRAEEA